MKIKILSWNIWHGKHLDKIIQFLRSADADILGIQEVAEKNEEGKTSNTASIIAKKLGYESIYSKATTLTNFNPQYDLGNAILTKFPIQTSYFQLLSGEDLYKSTPQTEPRVAVIAEIKTGSKTLKVITTHLAYSARFIPHPMRDLQVKNLIKLIRGPNTILMGDFNSLPKSQVIKQISKHLVNTDPNPKDPTWTIYPFDFPDFKETELRHRLDYIFVSHDVKVLNFKVGKTDGSDHLPISAEIEI